MFNERQLKTSKEASAPSGRQIIVRGITILGITIVLGYSYFVLDGFIRGPRIIVTEPNAGFAATNEHITIAGQAIHVNTLSLNGAPIPFDLDGNFSESLLLAKGYNIITLEASDRYQRTVKKSMEITLLKPETPVATSTTPSTASTTSTGTSTSSKFKN